MCSLVVVSPSCVYAPLSETHFVSPTLLSSALLWTPSKTNLTFPLFFSQLLCLQNSSSRFPDSCFQIAHLNIKYHLVAGAKSKKKKKNSEWGQHCSESVLQTLLPFLRQVPTGSAFWMHAKWQGQLHLPSPVCLLQCFIFKSAYSDHKSKACGTVTVLIDTGRNNVHMPYRSALLWVSSLLYIADSR